MGIQTVAEFKADLESALGRSLDSARSIRWLNNAMREFAYAFKFPELQGTASVSSVEGQSNYDLPADFRAFTDDGVVIDGPQDRTGGRLPKETRTMFLRQYNWNGNGRPQAYHTYGKKLVVRPASDATVTNFMFDYWKRVTPLAADGDVSMFNDDWDDVIFRGALYRGHMNFGEHDRMINVFNMFLGLVRSRVEAEDLEEFPEGGISYIQSQFDGNRR